MGKTVRMIIDDVEHAVDVPVEFVEHVAKKIGAKIEAWFQEHITKHHDAGRDHAAVALREAAGHIANNVIANAPQHLEATDEEIAAHEAASLPAADSAEPADDTVVNQSAAGTTTTSTSASI